MNDKRVYNIVLELSKYIDKENINIILLQMKDVKYINDFIDLLIVKITKLFDNCIISEKKYNLLFELICQEFDIKSLEILKERYKWLTKLNLESNFNLEKNHREIYEIFNEFNKLLYFNNIEHYYTSGILSFLLINKPLERYHHDLDIFILENDLEKLENVAHKYNFSFVRILGDRLDGTKRRILKMFYKDYEIPITIFMYSREIDGSITQKDYFFDKMGNLMVEEIHNCPKCVDLSFCDKERYYNEIPYKSISLEALYLCKNGGRPKDIYDCSIISPFINKEKLHSLVKSSNENKKNKCFEILDENIKKFIGNKDFVMEKTRKNQL